LKRALMFEISKNDDPCDFSWLDECAQKLASISRDGYAVVLRDEAIVDGLKGGPRMLISFDTLANRPRGLYLREANTVCENDVTRHRLARNR